MKTYLIAFFLLSNILWAGSNEQKVKLGYQMQEAVLRTQDIRKVEELLKQGVDINAPIGCGTYSPLDGAVDTKNFEMLKFLLEHGAKPKGRELANAAFFANQELAMNFVKALLAAGVDCNATSSLGTALISATYRGHEDLVVLLLSQPGIKVNEQNVDGTTALMNAAEQGSLSSVEILLKAGANPNLKNDQGETAADLAEAGIKTRQTIISKLKSAKIK